MSALLVSHRSLLASLLLALAAACSAGDGTAPLPSPPPPPAPPSLTGDLVVQVLQGFGSYVPVGVSITIVGPGISVSQSATTVRLNGLTPGAYSVELTLREGGNLVKGGCIIPDASRRIASVVAGTTTSVEFRVSCSVS